MKKIIIFLFSAIQFMSLNSQTVNITCSGGGTDCFSVTSCITPNTYLASINNGAHPVSSSPNDYFREIEWTATGAKSSAIPSGANLTFSVTWDNQPNSTANFVTLKVKYTRNNSNLDTLTVYAQIAVTVKYVAPITQMSINGVVASNTQPNSVACGNSQPITLSVPSPTTNPSSGITYFWTFPTGWFFAPGTSTNSNTVTVYPNPGTEGTISLQVRRNDVVCNQESYGITVTRPKVNTPTLTGVPTASICSGSYFYLIGNATNATSYNWSTTGALSNTFADNDFAEILTTSGSNGTVTFTVDNACQSPKSITRTVYVGTPVITNATVDWQPLAYPNYINNPGFLTITVNNAEGSSTNWTLLNGSGNIYYAGQNQVSVYAYPFMRVEGVTSNQCGTGEARTFYVQDISNGYYRMASPNPTTSIISSDILAMDALKKVTLVSAARPGIVRMYNANGSLNADTHRNNNILSFDTGNLPRGLYYLNFFFEGNRNYTEQIELN